MIVTPAIDLRNGRCVQLVGGSYDRQVIQLDDPVAIARKWEDQGFSTLHVVDLDAATGAGSNFTIVQALLESKCAEIQVGGGLRSGDLVDGMISAGAERVVVGTRALTDRAWLETMAARHPKRIVVAADVRERALVTSGWKEAITNDLMTEIRELSDLPLAGLLVTAVHREGLMEGPDLALLRDVVRNSRLAIQAAGGIATTQDIRALSDIGVHTAIVGMALYTGAITSDQIAEVPAS